MISFTATGEFVRPSRGARVQTARRLYRLLIRLLSPGGTCAECGTRAHLEIDHRDGRDWVARSVSVPQRVDLYWTEYLVGVELRALCRSCNAIDGGGRRYHGGQQ